MAEPKIRFKNHHSDWERTVVDDVFESLIPQHYYKIFFLST